MLLLRLQRGGGTQEDKELAEDCQRLCQWKRREPIRRNADSRTRYQYCSLFRRNPVIADVFAQMDFMEKRGSGLRKICRESAILPNYKEERKPTFRSEGTVFYTVFKNVNYKEGSAPESILKTTPITTPITTPMTTPISGMKSGTKIIELMAGNPKITASEISVALTLSRDHVKKLIRNLRENGIIQREGTNKGGYWKVLPPYNNPKKTNK